MSHSRHANSDSVDSIVLSADEINIPIDTSLGNSPRKIDKSSILPRNIKTGRKFGGKFKQMQREDIMKISQSFDILKEPLMSLISDWDSQRSEKTTLQKNYMMFGCLTHIQTMINQYLKDFL